MFQNTNHLGSTTCWFWLFYQLYRPYTSNTYKEWTRCGLRGWFCGHGLDLCHTLHVHSWAGGLAGREILFTLCYTTVSIVMSLTVTRPCLGATWGSVWCVWIVIGFELHQILPLFTWDFTFIFSTGWFQERIRAWFTWTELLLSQSSKIIIV